MIESLASQLFFYGAVSFAFRRFSICEERGSGFEKAVATIELYGLPPLKFQEVDNSFRVIMYKPKTFAQLTPAERIEACYQHSIIKYYSGNGMTNTSLRERFKMSEKQRSQVSLVIREALALNRIKFRDPDNNAPKFAEYIPYWDNFYLFRKRNLRLSYCESNTCYLFYEPAIGILHKNNPFLLV